MKSKLFAALLTLGFASAAMAAPLTGQFSVTGGSVTDNGTSLTFSPNTISVGAASTLLGSFKNILSPTEVGTITSPINYKTYVPNSAQILFGAGTPGQMLDFSIASITEVADGAFTDFTGTGIITSNTPGFTTPTAANLLFSTQASGAVTFSATAVVPSAVPEPSSLALLGTGIVGLAGFAKRRLMA